jgi:hypothetical protein
MAEAGAEGAEAEVLPVLAAEARALPVRRFARGLAGERGSSASAGLGRRSSAAIPAVHAAAMAAGSFVAGAAVAGLVHRRHRRSNALARGGGLGRAITRGGTRKGKGAELIQIVGSRSLLVDVHLLGVPQADR